MSQKSSSHNHLLQLLLPADLALLAPHFQYASVRRGRRIEDAGRAVHEIYFPEAGLLTVTASGGHRQQIEVTLLGREGMTGIAVVLGDTRASITTHALTDGHGLIIPAQVLHSALAASRTLHAVFLAYVQAVLTQTTQIALATGVARLEERVAGWMLAAQDRLQSEAIPITHEGLSTILAVRRASITEIFRTMKNKGLIDTSRGYVHIRDRGGIEALADAFYGVTEAEYRRLTGWSGGLADP